MKKSTIRLIGFVLLPLLAVGVEGYPGSVQVWIEGAEEIQYCSFFALVPNSGLAFMLPLTAILSCIITVQAVIYCVNRSQKILPSMQVMAFIALLASSIPTMAPTNPKVVPNVLVPILLCLSCLMIGQMKKKPAPKREENPGNRLRMHR